LYFYFHVKTFILADSTQFVGFANATSRETLPESLNRAPENILFMNSKYFFIKCLLVLLALSSCSSKKSVIGTYTLKQKPNSYNIILRLDSNTYKLETTGTIASGNTKGNWRMEKSNIILMPEKSKITHETLGDTIVEVEEYRPFCDTLKAKVKKNKIIISRNPYNEITLRKIKAIR